MMVTPFGDLKWKDPQGLWDFLGAHDLKHQSLAQRIVMSGVQDPAFLLSATIDDYWLTTHYTQHSLMSQLFVPATNTYLSGLYENPMSDEETFYNWHANHNLIHQYEDQAFNI